MVIYWGTQAVGRTWPLAPDGRRPVEASSSTVVRVLGVHRCFVSPTPAAQPGLDVDRRDVQETSCALHHCSRPTCAVAPPTLGAELLIAFGTWPSSRDTYESAWTPDVCARPFSSLLRRLRRMKFLDAPEVDIRQDGVGTFGGG